MQGLAAAQRQYDRQAPAEDVVEAKRFSREQEARWFIADFAASEGDADKWLEENGGRNLEMIGSAALLKICAKRYVVNELVADLATAFVDLMADCAYERWCEQ